MGASCPDELFAQIFEQVMQKTITNPKHQAIPENWQIVYGRFTAIWIADGSTLEALRRKLKALKEQEKTLAGKIMMVVEAFSHRPVTTWYTTNSKANDKIWCDQLLERLPVGGLLIFDLGWRRNEVPLSYEQLNFSINAVKGHLPHGKGIGSEVIVFLTII